ncbi:non-ribosomal peptide synthetase [Chryseobacterium sp. 52]|uniref:non-ribosomal peptide synthetase n=1 Tax=Chryseobacterium sp. 52 TaxID=2035213 RepID=UPI000C18C800|nr:non-ribosomal peptide synthetase [Chryseobacterium sp. 52]
MIAFIEKLKEQNIQISLEGGDLKVTYFGDDLSAGLIESIKAMKPQLIQYLMETDASKSKNIPIAPLQEAYQVSNAQRRMLVLSSNNKMNVAYNISYAYKLTGNLNREYLQLACDDLIQRHEVLRTIFFETEMGSFKQKILAPSDCRLKLVYEDFSGYPDKSKSISNYLKEKSLKEFDKQKPFIKFYLLKLEENSYVLNYITHHTVCDGWSMIILMRDLFSLYISRTKNIESTLPVLRIQYKDFAVWEDKKMNAISLSDARNYWLKQFSNEVPILDLPVDNPYPVVRSYKGGLVHKTIDLKLSDDFRENLNHDKSTLFMGFLALTNILIYKYTNQKDIVIGSPVSIRDQADLENQIGVYINTLPLRVILDVNKGFKTLLDQVKELTLEAYKYKDYPFEQLIEDLKIKTDANKNPLFNVMAVMQNNDIRNEGKLIQDSNEFKIETYKDKGAEYVTSKLDLAFFFTDNHEKGLVVGIEYNTDIYNSSTIERICRHLDTLLRSAIEHPDMSIKDLEILSAADRIELLESFNDTTVSYPQGDNIVSLFEKQAISTPDHVALVFEEEELTYKELDEKSNQLARYLLSRHSLGRGVLCGIMMDRSLDMIVSILAILKTGSGYVPIDVDYPQDRIDYMVEDSGCILVIDSALYADFTTIDESYENTGLEISISGNDLAYVIYTSGTTGHPKGVMVEHKGVVNLCFWHIETFDVGRDTKSTLYSNYSFDASVWELFPYLLKGASLYIVPSVLRLDLIALNNFYEDSGITHAFLPTALCESFIQIENHSLSYLFTGGDRLLTSNTSNHYKLVNNYGPTENSVVSTSFTLCQRLSQDMIPIGSPISNTQLYILDGDLRLVPKGAVGEICVSGSGLARGYLNRPELTAEKFISHPFKEGERLYRTGDLGRWLADGNIEFMGRNDDQVKIRGYRIELGEIAQVMNQHPLITNCLVHATEGSSENKDLILYYVSESSLSIRDLRSYLSERLPSYMIPGYYLPLDELPLTSNGKVDRKALPMPEGMGIDTGVEYVSPQTSTEKILVKIWSDVLSLDADNIGLYDNFFDLGGHSLKATAILAKARTAFKVNLNISELYNLPTIEGMAKEINRKQWLNSEVSKDDINIEIEL